MRTTITLEDDVAAVVDRLRRERGVGVSAAVNELVRRGMNADPTPRHRFQQRTSSMRARIDVTNVAEAIELLDGPAAR